MSTRKEDWGKEMRARKIGLLKCIFMTSNNNTLAVGYYIFLRANPETKNN